MNAHATLAPRASAPATPLFTPPTTASATGVDPAKAGTMPNPVLSALVTEFDALKGEIDVLEQDPRHKGIDCEKIPGWLTRAHRLDEITTEIYDVRAASFADVLLVSRFLQIRWIQDDPTTAADLGYNLAEDITRLQAAAPAASLFTPLATAGDDPIIALHREWLARHADYSVCEHGDGDPAYDRIGAVERRAIASPATTVLGAVTALEWAQAEFREYKDEGVFGDELILALLDGVLGVLRTLDRAVPRFADIAPDGDEFHGPALPVGGARG